MFDPKLFVILGLSLICVYGILTCLHQFEWFKKYEDMGVTFAFEGVLGMCALIVGFIGIWINGYRRGLENGKAESNKT